MSGVKLFSLLLPQGGSVLGCFLFCFSACLCVCVHDNSQKNEQSIFNDFGFLVDITPNVMGRPS